MNLDAIKNLPRKQWYIIIGALTVVVLGLLGWGLAGSLHRLGADPAVPGFLRRAGDANSLMAQIKAREDSIAKELAVFATLEQKTKQLEAMKADIASARKRLPTEAQKAEVRQLIEDLARQVGTSATGALVVRSVSIREAAPAGGAARSRTATDYKTIEYQTQVSGDMEGLIQYINLIERNERFMTVEGIQIATGGVGLERGSGKIEYKPHSAQLRIVTYIDSTATTAGAARGR